jgi:RNA polymerase sigma factor (sigma-70 family)
MTTTPLTSLEDSDDATLATAAARGDRVAFAAIYNRYADRLHDFCVGMLRDRHDGADCVQEVFVIAATRLGRLREPDRLKSWLYAIARNEALARIRARRRERPSDELPEAASAEPDLPTLAARSELADLISDACGGLSDRDQLVLELAYRQGLDGPELADALGVSHKNANTLVERLRATVARSLGALLVCRRVRSDPALCPELAALIEHWDGNFTVLMRKRAARHIEDCPNCAVERERMVTPTALLAGIPALIPAPAWLRDHTLNQSAAMLTPPHSPQTVGDAPSSSHDQASWWPPRDLDTADLRPWFVRHHMPVIGGAAVLVAAATAAVLFGTPTTHRVEQTGNPGGPVSVTTVPTLPGFSPRGVTTTTSATTTHNPGPSGPTAPSSGAGGPIVGPGTPQGPTAPPGAGGGPIVGPGAPQGPTSPVTFTAGPIINPGAPQAQPAPPVTFTAGPIINAPQPPPPPKKGPVIAPGRVPPSQIIEGDPNCQPPECRQPNGPLQ